MPQSIDQAWTLYADADFAGALSLAERLLKAAPANPDALAVAALSRARLGGDPAVGLRQIRKALKSAPNAFVLSSALGELHGLLGDFTAAQAAYEKALALAPDAGGVFNNLTGIRKYTEFDATCARMQALYDAEETPQRPEDGHRLRPGQGA